MTMNKSHTSVLCKYCGSNKKGFHNGYCSVITKFPKATTKSEGWEEEYTKNFPYWGGAREHHAFIRKLIKRAVKDEREKIAEKAREVLKGIDKDEIDGGWWGTSTGIEFGKKKLDELLSVIREGKS